MRAINSTTGVGPGAARTFTFDSTRQGPYVNLPADNVPAARHPCFLLGAVTATAYQFQIDDNADYSSPSYSTLMDQRFPNPITVTNAKPSSLHLVTPLLARAKCATRQGTGVIGRYRERLLSCPYPGRRWSHHRFQLG